MININQKSRKATKYSKIGKRWKTLQIPKALLILPKFKEIIFQYGKLLNNLGNLIILEINLNQGENPFDLD
jgi:hypothetical protein